MDRRSFLRASVSGFLGAMLARQAGESTAWAGDAPARPRPRATSVIVLWMNGGPSHLDTWDPKPGAATGGPFKAIKTKNPKLTVCEHMPRLAATGDRLTVLRGMASKEGNHQRAQYLMHTGYSPNPTVVHPSLGGWIAKKVGAPPNGLPPFVSLGGPSYGAGFLGVQYGPFVVQRAGELPDDTRAGVDDARFGRRLGLLDRMEAGFAARTGQGFVDDRRAVYGQARRMMSSKDLAAFDVSSEPAAVRQAYGDTDFGRGCLVARRLVESGVKLVEVVLDGWDTHKDNFNRVKKLLGTLDPAMSALVGDLRHRRLLDTTLVLWMGDFGRTPRVNGNEGRDHWPHAWNAVMAGGGTRPGVLGGTDARGEKAAGKPFGVPDLMATATTLMGIDPDEEVISPIGRPIAVTDGGTPIAAAIA